MASSTLMLACSRVLVGVGEAVFPAGSSVAITQSFPPDKMARAKSIIQSGASVGFAAGSIVITALIAYFNWRVMFIILGVVGLGLAVSLYLALRGEGLGTQAAPRPRQGEKQRILALLRNALTWKIMFIYFFTNIVFWGLQSWLPSYWVQVKGMSMLSMGAYSAIPPTMGFLSFLGSGWLLDRTFNKREKYLVCIGAGVSACFIYLMACAESILMAFFYLTVSNVFLNAISISVFVAIMKHYPKESVGTATGLINSLAQIGSFLSPVLMGVILHRTHQNYQVAFGFLVGCALVTCAVAASIPGTPRELDQ